MVGSPYGQRVQPPRLPEPSPAGALLHTATGVYELQFFPILYPGGLQGEGAVEHSTVRLLEGRCTHLIPEGPRSDFGGFTDSLVEAKPEAPRLGIR